MLSEGRYKEYLPANASIAHPVTVTQEIMSRNLLHGTVIVGTFAVILMTAGCGNAPPAPSNGADLNGVEMMALRGDPYAIAGLTPVQRQRVNSYQASHPGIQPTWGHDVMTAAMGAGAGYLLAGSTSAARTGAAVTTAAALAPEVVAPAAERTVARVAVGDAAAGAAERVGLGEVAAGTVERVGLGEVAVGAAERVGIVELLELLIFF